VSTVSSGTSATNKPRMGRLRITHGRAPCPAGQIPIPRCGPPSDRFILVSRRVPPPPGSVQTIPATWPCLEIRGGPPSRGTAVMVATAATCPHPDTCHGQKSATTRNLEATCPRAGIPLGEEVNDRPILFDSSAHTPNVLVDLAQIEPAGQLEGVLLGVIAPPAAPQA